jgi:hypothetical protein
VTDDKHVLRVRALFGNRLNDKKIEYIVVKDDRAMDFVYELFAIPFNFFGISLNSILARRYR